MPGMLPTENLTVSYTTTLSITLSKAFILIYSL